MQEQSKFIQTKVARLTRGATARTAVVVEAMDGKLTSVSTTLDNIRSDAGDAKFNLKELKLELSNKTEESNEAAQRRHEEMKTLSKVSFGSLTDHIQDLCKSAVCKSIM